MKRGGVALEPALELEKGTEILKTAWLCGTGVSAIQRIKATMKQTV
jgi:hypothetical protein